MTIVELYINDFLMNLKRVKCNGRIGTINVADAVIQNLEVRQSAGTPIIRSASTF